MRLSIPCTWDDEIFRFLEEKDTSSWRYPVFELYGSMRISAIGGGRDAGSLMTRCRRRSDIETFVRKIHATGLKFNYTINATCLGNAEYRRAERKAIIDELEWILSFSDAVTVAVPYLMDLVRQIAGNKVEIVCSVLAQIDTPRKLQHFASLGADRFVVSISLNRDLRRIETMKHASSAALELLVNDSCLFECPFRLLHYNENAHAGRIRDVYYPDYCMTKCCIARLDNPEELLKSRWIRPHDLPRYESMVDVIKISGRGFPTPWVMNAVNAYASGSYSGNIFDLLTVIPLPPDNHGILDPDVGRPFRITNNALDEYMARFYKGLCNGDCDTCQFCKRFTTQHIIVDAVMTSRLRRDLENQLRLLYQRGGVRSSIKEAALKMCAASYCKDGVLWKILHQCMKGVKSIRK